ELRIHRLRAGPEGEERRVDRRQLDAADEAGLPALRFARGDDAEEVRGLLNLEDHRRDVRRDGASRGGDEDALRELLARSHGRVLELEAVAEGEVVAVLPIRAEALGDLRRRLHFLIRDLRAEL